MKVKVKVDMQKIRAKLGKLSKEFGDTHEQLVARLGVSAARNLAFETEQWGKTGTKKKQEEAIMGGIRDACRIVSKERIEYHKKHKDFTVIESGEELSRYIDTIRTKNGGVRFIPDKSTPRCTEAVVKKCFTIRRKTAGMAKGGWIGSGMAAGRLQSGGDRITIGKNYLSYTHKFAHFGSAVMRGAILAKSYILLRNAVRFSSSKRVLSPSKIIGAKDHAVRDVVKWFKMAIRKRKIKV